jgi:hypothetical protein
MAGAIRIPQDIPKRDITTIKGPKLPTVPNNAYTAAARAMAKMKGFLRPILSESLPAGIRTITLVTPLKVNRREIREGVNPRLPTA